MKSTVLWIVNDMKKNPTIINSKWHEWQSNLRKIFFGTHWIKIFSAISDPKMILIESANITTIGDKSRSAICTMWKPNQFTMIKNAFYPFFPVKICSFHFFWSSLSNESIQRMRNKSEQHIVTLKFNNRIIETVQNSRTPLTRTDIIKLNQHVQKKRHTLIHVPITYDIREMIFLITSRSTFDDKMNFHNTEMQNENERNIRKTSVSDSTLSFTTCWNPLTTRSKRQPSDIRETIYDPKNEFRFIRTKEIEWKDTATVHASHICKKTQTSKFKSINTHNFKKKKKHDHTWIQFGHDAQAPTSTPMFIWHFENYQYQNHRWFRFLSEEIIFATPTSSI